MEKETYSFYQLRSKKGEGEFDYCVVKESSYLESIMNDILENERDLEYYDLVMLTVEEEVLDPEKTLPEEFWKEYAFKLRRLNNG